MFEVPTHQYINLIDSCNSNMKSIVVKSCGNSALVYICVCQRYVFSPCKNDF